jgi:hypothetical protein
VYLEGAAFSTLFYHETTKNSKKCVTIQPYKRADQPHKRAENALIPVGIFHIFKTDAAAAALSFFRGLSNLLDNIYDICYITSGVNIMARGFSGRIVLEIDPATKDDLYIALAKKRITLKDWFLKQCNIFIEESYQSTLFNEAAAENEPLYNGKIK